MINNIRYSDILTPSPGPEWQELTNNQRLNFVQNVLIQSTSSTVLLATSAKADGQIILKFLEPIGVEKRGTLLLDLEELFKKEIDPGLTVWLESLGDRNSLRNLRGIEVKS